MNAKKSSLSRGVAVPPGLLAITIQVCRAHGLHEFGELRTDPAQLGLECSHLGLVRILAGDRRGPGSRCFVGIWCCKKDFGYEFK